MGVAVCPDPSGERSFNMWVKDGFTDSVND